MVEIEVETEKCFEKMGVCLMVMYVRACMGTIL